MYLVLCQDRASILTALGFYAEHDLVPPEENSDSVATKHEEEELRQIASALTLAAVVSEMMPAGVMVATLEKVQSNPSLLLTGELPQPVEWEIAGHYQRGDESPGTHWRDVWGDQVAAFPGEVEQPTDANIKKAAASALEQMQNGRKRGRTYKIYGTQFNGFSQANAYGDDFQDATNYPLVRIVNSATGHVFYCRTHNPSTMAIATGSKQVSTSFDVPAGAETGQSELFVIANGIPSSPVFVTVQ